MAQISAGEEGAREQVIILLSLNMITMTIIIISESTVVILTIITELWYPIAE